MKDNRTNIEALFLEIFGIIIKLDSNFFIIVSFTHDAESVKCIYL